MFHSVRLKYVFLFLSTKYVVIAAGIFLPSSSLFAPISDICGVCVGFEESVRGRDGGGESHDLTNLSPGPPASDWPAISSHHSHPLTSQPRYTLNLPVQT